jgi:hypothetical protein
MKVFEFSEMDLNSQEWIVAETLLSAMMCLSKTCDMYSEADQGFDGLKVKQLTEQEIKQKKYDPDPLGTGEFDSERAIPFSDAIKLTEKKMPYLLCSYID